MSIELHCPHCNKLIRAPENAGGQHGKCPYCQQSVYIPTAPSDDGPIGLAPLDLQNETELQEESVRLAAQVDRDAEQAPEASGAKPRAPGAPPRPEPQAAAAAPVDVPREVERYVRAMKESKLQEAEQIVARLKRSGSRAHDYVEGLYLDPMPPKIGDIPTPLVKGFLGKLLEGLR